MQHIGPGWIPYDDYECEFGTSCSAKGSLCYTFGDTNLQSQKRTKCE